MEPHGEMTPDQFNEMMQARETSWVVHEFRLDPRFEHDQGEENDHLPTLR